MKSIFTLVFLAIFFAGNTQNITTDKRLKGLDTFVNRVLKDWHAPGVTIAVVEKNKIIFAGGFGYANYEKKIPVTANTLFAIGSCTKAFTASMLAMLERDGKINFDSPVRNYLPELKFYNEYLNDHVTLRDMMCHRTGLPRHDFSWYGSTATRSELLERIQWLEPSAELREKYQYNNFMFLAQGMLLEKLTGKSWEQNLRERILKPLNMVHTNMSVTEMEKANDKSLAYNVKKDSIIEAIPYRNIDNIAPAGAINSCAADMASWLITWINDGKFNGTEIIPASFRNQAITTQVATGGGLPGDENPDVHLSGYGLAWGMSSYRAHYRVEHSGGIDGFSTSTSFFPSDSIGIFVVTNQGGPTSSIRNFIADRMLGLSYRNWSKMQLDPIIKARATMQKRTNSDSLQQKPNTKPSHALPDYTGVFENKGYGEVKTFIERDTMWIDYNEAGKRTKSYLQHYHYDIFRARSTDETEENFDAQKIKFNTDLKGNIESLESKMEPTVKEIIFTRKAPEVKLTKADLEKYTGDFLLTGLTIKVYTRGENTLMVLVPGQPDYELVPAGNDTFNFKILKGYSVQFEMNDKKECTALSFIQPNGTFKAEKKK
jgi:CubicO group peptidase (beta-lactamase class C family)